MTSKTTNKFSPEVRARAVRMLLDHEAEQRRLHAHDIAETELGQAGPEADIVRNLRLVSKLGILRPRFRQ